MSILNTEYLVNRIKTFNKNTTTLRASPPLPLYSPLPAWWLTPPPSPPLPAFPPSPPIAFSLLLPVNVQVSNVLALPPVKKKTFKNVNQNLL